MSDKAKRREALRAYKEREETGGIYRIINTQSGWQSELQATANLAGIKNRFDFAIKQKSRSFNNLLRDQWDRYAPEVFELVEVERLVKKPEQSSAEFAEELDTLLALWQEKE